MCIIIFFLYTQCLNVCPFDIFDGTNLFTIILTYYMNENWRQGKIFKYDKLVWKKKLDQQYIVLYLYYYNATKG